jgi:hypothetical protein
MILKRLGRKRVLLVEECRRRLTFWPLENAGQVPYRETMVDPRQNGKVGLKQFSARL